MTEDKILKKLKTEVKKYKVLRRVSREMGVSTDTIYRILRGESYDNNVITQLALAVEQEKEKIQDIAKRLNF